jgi:hypothetical protein
MIEEPAAPPAEEASFPPDAFAAAAAMAECISDAVARRGGRPFPRAAAAAAFAGAGNARVVAAADSGAGSAGTVVPAGNMSCRCSSFFLLFSAAWNAGGSSPPLAPPHTRAYST